MQSTASCRQIILRIGILLFTIILASLSGLAHARSSQIYTLFTDPETLSKQLNHPAQIILDVRDAEAYGKGHIPQAVNLAIGKTYNATGRTDRVASIDVIQKLLGNAGIDMLTHVIIYDDGSYKNAGRMFWVLEVFGLKHVRVLNGGIAAWRQQHLPLSTTPYIPEKKIFIAAIQPDRLATKFTTQLASQTGNRQIIDSRSTDEYNGIESITERKGHIPSARNVPWDRNYTTDVDGVAEIRPIKDLVKIYSFLDTRKPVITYCNKGKQSSFTYLILRELGYNVSHYDGSWYEWSNDVELPIQHQKKP